MDGIGVITLFFVALPFICNFAAQLWTLKDNITKVTYLGHACVNTNIDDTFFLIDSFISPNPLAKHIDISSAKASYILITHAHADRTVNVEAIVKHTSAQLITNPGVLAHFEALGPSGHSTNLGGSHRFIDGKAKIKMIKAEYFSLFPDGSHGGDPTGFLIDYNDETIHVAGDAALRYDMKIIPHQCKVNLGIFPIGNSYTMRVHDVLTAARFVQVDDVLGVHHDTFPTIKIDKESSKQKFKDDHCRLHLIEIGTTLDLKDFDIYVL